MPAGSAPRKSQCFLFKSEVSRKTEVPAQGSQARRSSLLLTGRTAFLFSSRLQLIGWGPPTLERAIFLSQSAASNVNLIQHTVTDTWRIMLDQIPGHCVIQSKWHKINHYPHQKKKRCYFWRIGRENHRGWENKAFTGICPGKFTSLLCPVLKIDWRWCKMLQAVDILMS